MFRASACFALIIGIIALATTTAYLAMHATGLSGLPAYILGIAIFALILTGLIMLVSTINDHINSDSALMKNRRSRQHRAN